MKQIILIGRIGEDAKINTLESGKFALNFNLAVSFKAKKTDTEYSTEWFGCSQIFNQEPTKLAQYLLKGTRLSLIGDINFKQVKAENGNVYFNKNVYINSFEILFDKKTETGDTPPM